MKSGRVFSLVPKDELIKLRAKYQEDDKKMDATQIPDPLMSKTERSIREAQGDLDEIDMDTSVSVLDKIIAHANRMKQYQHDVKKAVTNRGSAGIDYTVKTPNVTDIVSTASSQNTENVAINASEKELLERLKLAGIEVDAGEGVITLGGSKLSPLETRNILRDATASKKRQRLSSRVGNWRKFKKLASDRRVSIPRYARREPTAVSPVPVQTSPKSVRKLSTATSSIPVRTPVQTPKRDKKPEGKRSKAYAIKTDELAGPWVNA